MRTTKVLASGLQLFVAIKLIVLGGIFVTIALFPALRSWTTLMIHSHPGIISSIGYLTIGLGFLLFIAFYVVNRGQYYQVSMGPPIDADIKIIHDYARAYWQKQFPDLSTNIEVILHPHQKIEVIAEIPAISLDDQQKLLSQTEEELGRLLSNTLSYQKEFLFTLLQK